MGKVDRDHPYDWNWGQFWLANSLNRKYNRVSARNNISKQLLFLIQIQIGKVFGFDKRVRLGVSPRGCYPRQISGGSRLKTRGGSDVMQCHVRLASLLRCPVMRRAWWPQIQLSTNRLQIARSARNPNRPPDEPRALAVRCQSHSSQPRHS